MLRIVLLFLLNILNLIPIGLTVYIFANDYPLYVFVIYIINIIIAFISCVIDDITEYMPGSNLKMLSRSVTMLYLIGFSIYLTITNGGIHILNMIITWFCGMSISLILHGIMKFFNKRRSL